ncbi:hypothetical protein GQ53DRAFT_820552 [Thozetella sp. PMI_491]|nr:hypothetical protein GQ53DRAFT_820552 [Thozetella sp. PMI_491]
MRPGFLLLKRRPLCPQCAPILGMRILRRYASNSKFGPFHKGLVQDQGLPKLPARTRFAPSPTGYLHLGSLRTALYNYLLARATGGQFLLRLEDTDQSRLVPDAERRLYEDLKWTGLSWDEGPDIGGPFGPYRQSERMEHYHSHADTLIKEGKAYRCFCSPEELERHKAEAHAHGASTNYPGTCREVSAEESESRRHEPHAVRFKSSKTPVEFHDLVYKRYKKGETEEDFILVKRDGFPTYHFANVVDDHMMEITHVIRGAEWLISTPKHIELYQAFDWTPPKFAHLGLLVNKDGQKLSKRHGGFHMQDYRDQDYLPAALLNFVALHGWRRRGLKSEVLTLEGMTELFDLRCGKGDIAVTFEKLPYLDAKHRHLLVFQDPPNTTLLSQVYLKPIHSTIARLDKAAQNAGKEASSFFRLQPQQQDVAGRTGEIVADLQRGTPEQMDAYILMALRISSKLPNRELSIQAWVETHQHLFWAVTPATLAARLSDIPFGEIYLGDEPCRLSDVLRYFLAAAHEIRPREWKIDTIQSVFTDTMKGVTFRDRNTNEINPAGGMKFLRWALVGGDHGPSLNAIMDLLGKEETVTRLERALQVAEAPADSTVAELRNEAV